jgi:hypothetical protein
MTMPPRAETTPTITRPDLDRDQDIVPKALRPYNVVVLDGTTRVTGRLKRPR